MARIGKVLQSQRYIMGPEVSELEDALSEYVGVRHACTCSSGTDALVIPLMALGLTRQDAVFVPSFTFFATAESVTLAGGTPVFVDSEPTCFNLSPDDLERAIRATIAKGALRPCGIIAVDLFGQLADYDAIQKIADTYGLFLIEDAAQSFGATGYGKTAGAFGIAAAVSFFPAKPLGCYGDGGAVFTNDDSLAKKMRSIRVHGQGVDKYDNVRIGLNGRLDTIQAAVLLSKLAIFDDELASRAAVAAAYSQQLDDILITPRLRPGNTSAWAQYTLVADNEPQRSAILEALRAAEIPSAIYYPVPVHRSTAYASCEHNQRSLPVCEDLSQRVLSIPMHPYLSTTNIENITAVIRGAL
jgi:dTDP-4-amino-4,6-dideoxygalactose transaminase